MIVVDIETSGLDLNACGIWQIGAIDTDNPTRTFLDECRIEHDDIIDPGALAVCNVTEEYLRDPAKQSQRELLKKFFLWCAHAKIKNFVCQNPQFDTTFLHLKAQKYKLYYPFYYRAFDLHSIAQMKHVEIYHQLQIDNISSGMDLKRILEFCGMQDGRSAHNALEDAKLTAECFVRLLYGKTLLEEYQEFILPDYLKK